MQCTDKQYEYVTGGWIKYQYPVEFSSLFYVERVCKYSNTIIIADANLPTDSSIYKAEICLHVSNVSRG